VSLYFRSVITPGKHNLRGIFADVDAIARRKVRRRAMKRAMLLAVNGCATTLWTYHVRTRRHRSALQGRPVPSKAMSAHSASLRSAYVPVRALVCVFLICMATRNSISSCLDARDCRQKIVNWPNFGVLGYATLDRLHAGDMQFRFSQGCGSFFFWVLIDFDS